MSIRRLGPLGAMVLVAGNMVGSGLFMLPAALGAVGSITLISWLIATAGALALALAFGILGVLRPGADGATAYVTEGLHPALGHLGWFCYWLNCWVGTAAIAVAATGYLAWFVPALKTPVAGAAAAVAILWLCVLVCIVGPRMVARLSGATLLIGLVPIVIAIGVGFYAFDPAVFAASWNVSGKPAFTAATAAVAPVFWAYLGLESANICAAVIDNPRRNLPIAAVGGVALAAVIYIAASVAIMGLYPARDLAASTAPFADAIRGVLGAGAAALVAFCAFAKAAGTTGGWTLMTAETGRSAAALGFLPRFLSTVSPDRRPVRDLLLAGVLMTIATVGSMSKTIGGQFAILINVSVILSMILYLLCSAALLRLSAQAETPGLRLLARLAALAGGGFSLWIIVTMDASLRLPALVTALVSLALYALHRFTRRAAAAA